MKGRYLLILSALLLLSLPGCFSSKIDPDKITSINIIDRNGLSETINAKDRLTAYENTDFLSPQPYQKVMRVFGHEKNGDVKSTITSYHPNGQVKQLLEAINNRAQGSYKEWYQNGQLKIAAHVIGGSADLNTHAEQTWLFDGVNKAWDEDGHLAAEILYEKGELEGEAIYYHPSGKVWKRSPHKKNALNGTQYTFREDGALLQSTEYSEGAKEGLAIRYWSLSKIAYKEHYEKGLLMEAEYFDKDGSLVCSIQNGDGFRTVFGKKEILELQEYRRGIQEGIVKVFDTSGSLIRTWTVKDGEKHGEETDFFPASSQPKLQITWHQGMIQGPMKTWYENGNLESQREISDNKKNGLLTAWYRNGALMLVEEYDQDKLLKGEYFRLGEKSAVSTIDRGDGIATLFNPDGNFSRKIYYHDGKPLE